MSHFDGKTWLRHESDEEFPLTHVHIYEGTAAGLGLSPAETYVLTGAGWVDDSGDLVDVLLADDLDVLIAPVDLANQG